MQERERLVMTGMVLLLLALWLGFAVHRSPRFAGSLTGGVLGVSGALLMVFCVLYAPVKRIPAIKNLVTKRGSLRTLLAWHVYAGLSGSMLGLLHTGHKFDSVLGMLLTAAMLLVVVSGFIGRYLLNQTFQEVREKRATLSGLQAAYDRVAVELRTGPQPPFMTALQHRWSRWFLLGLTTETGVAAALQAIRLAESIADVDYAVKMHETLKRAFSRWLTAHIVLSAVLMVLLGIHVWAGLYYGLRWFHP
ncbi:MAG: hypothetical protein GDA65_20395 [Nitrospira sp. CR1.1]|nr:hypothetical protein [Nitrospira sp. CR1.1]